MNLIESIKRASAGHLLTEEAFDDFDQIYLDNHKEEITKLHDEQPESGKGLSGTEKEIYLFWSMHKDQVAERL